MTRQRAAIYDLMQTMPNFVSAQEVHDLLSERGESIGLATIYRNLQTMADAGQVDALRPDDSETTLYRYCHDDEHHHHLVCRRCGRTVEVTFGGLENVVNSLASDNGFSQVTHSLELFGLCNECATELESTQPATAAKS